MAVLTIAPTTEDLINALYAEEGKAEIVNGEIVRFMATGDEPIVASGEIFFSLRLYTKETKQGLAIPDNAAFLCDLPHRKSFSPDAAYYTGARSGMKFFPTVPVFAVEVRSEGDYGNRAEEAMKAKRADYFAAGTQVIWDVDLLSDTPIKSYSSGAPDASRIFQRGEVANAEPAVPGWRFAVDDLFA